MLITCSLGRQSPFSREYVPKALGLAKGPLASQRRHVCGA